MFQIEAKAKSKRSYASLHREQGVTEISPISNQCGMRYGLQSESSLINNGINSQASTSHYTLPSNSLANERQELFAQAFVLRFKERIEAYVNEAKSRNSMVTEVWELCLGLLAGVFSLFSTVVEVETPLQKYLQPFILMGITVIATLFITNTVKYAVSKNKQKKAKCIAAATYELRTSKEYNDILLSAAQAIFSEYKGGMRNLEGYYSGGLDVAMDAIALSAVGRAVNYIHRQAPVFRNVNTVPATLLNAVKQGTPEKKGIFRRRAGDSIQIACRDNQLRNIRAGEFFDKAFISSENDCA